jgi:hypothetical protein
VNPFPLIQFTVQLTESGKRIRQTFEVYGLFRVTFLHVPVGLIHGRPPNSGWIAGI